MAVNQSPVSGLVRYARSFYQLLGNRRKFERVPMSGPIWVTVKGAVVDNTQQCLCRDISPRGVGIDCPEPLTVNAFVQVHSDEYGERRLARVRYCITHEARYHAGLEFVAEGQDRE